MNSTTLKLKTRGYRLFEFYIQKLDIMNGLINSQLIKEEGLKLDIKTDLYIVLLGRLAMRL